MQCRPPAYPGTEQALGSPKPSKVMSWWGWCGWSCCSLGYAGVALPQAEGSGRDPSRRFSWKWANFLFLILVLRQIWLEWAGGISHGWGKADRQLGGRADRPWDCLSHVSLGSQTKNNQNPVLSHKQFCLPQTDDDFPVKKCFVRKFPVVPAGGREGAWTPSWRNLRILCYQHSLFL